MPHDVLLAQVMRHSVVCMVGFVIAFVLMRKNVLDVIACRGVSC